MQKGFASIFLILGGLILLVSVAGGVYYFGIKKPEAFEERLSRQNPVVIPSQQTQTSNNPTPSNLPTNTTDETANWKIYIDQEFKFEIKYPDTWYASKQQNNIIIASTSIPDMLTYNLPNSLTIRIRDKTAYSPNDPFFQERYSINKTKIGSFEATRFSSVQPGNIAPEHETIILLERESNFYHFYYPNSDNKGSHDEIFDQIISTFKFTN